MSDINDEDISLAIFYSDFDSSDSEKNIHDSPIEHIIGCDSDDLTHPESLKYYVKFPKSSYKNCTWKTYDDLIAICGSRSRIIGFIRHCGKCLVKSQTIPGCFVAVNGDIDKKWLIPEEILLMKDNHYFIKWTGLPYSEATEETTEYPQLILEYNRKLEDSILTNCPKPPTFKAEFENYKESPKYKGGHLLKEHQISGLNWLRHNYRVGRNCILADEMGLGKTIQAIALILDIYSNCDIPGPFLIAAPLSTIKNWQREINEWTDLKTVTLIGNVEEISQIIKYCFFDPKTEKKCIFKILLIPLNLVSKYKNLLRKFHFHCVIIDEAHKLKNIETKSYIALQSLSYAFCVLLTGTPVQNDLAEFWSLLHFIDPSNYSKVSDFTQKFGSNLSADKVEIIQKLVHPYILRRKKADAGIEIGEKEEIVVEVELTRLQRAVYRSILQDNKEVLLNKKFHFNLNNVAMQLRKICNHPFIIPNIESIAIKNYKSKYNIDFNTNLTEEQYCQVIVESSGKMIFLNKLLQSLKGHRVLIFSQMTTVLDILEEYCELMHFNYERIDGNVVGTDRQGRIDRFMKSDDSFVFLLSTKAGGLGLNLTIADTVVIYDSDWNPHNDIQAQSRCHRIGQKMNVNVYRLIARATYESEMYIRANKKLGLDAAIFEKHASNCTEKKLRTILERGAYFLLNEDESEIDKFENESIQQILEKRTKKKLDLYGNTNFSKLVIKNDQQHEQTSNDQDDSNILLNDDKSVGSQNSQNDYKSDTECESNLENNKELIQDHNNDNITNTKDNNKNNENGQQKKKKAPTFWDELFPSDDDEEQRFRKKVDIVCSKDALVSMITTIINDGYSKVYRQTMGEKNLLLLKATALRASTLFEANEHNQKIIKKFVGIQTIRLNQVLNSFPFTDFQWFQQNTELCQRFIDTINFFAVISRILSFLSMNDINYKFPASKTLPAWWSPHDDYSLLFYVYKHGYDFEKMISDEMLPFHWRVIASNLSVIPSYDILRNRLEILTKNIKKLIPSHFVNEISDICSLERFIHRQQMFLPFIPLNSVFLERILRCFQLYGIELNCDLTIDFVKMQTHSNLEFLDPQMYASIASTIISTLFIYNPKLSIVFEKRLHHLTSSIDEALNAISKNEFEKATERVFLFQRLRALSNQIECNIPWGNAESWWENSQCDKPFIKLLVNFGIGSLTLLIASEKSPFSKNCLIRPFNWQQYAVLEKMTMNPNLPDELSEFREWISEDSIVDRIKQYVNYLH
ncbi:SNF2 family N-terminal domain containing protein [Tritrichomonas foetus]|uniref:SNF2 family N-terminal domain containing protein n=1 Tax=Tritrichomonas foetus TaxID=1144522 RepID=A0A1J4KU25_9EUKA|nr:SNF2 family N-terminal domain containing protein [Tritrichomonas foetus]|eukprot:OHT14771.1 SNF2 family N-terminal domain containing protein [Tritrichomonas foetus]